MNSSQMILSALKVVKHSHQQWFGTCAVLLQTKKNAELCEYLLSMERTYMPGTA